MDYSLLLVVEINPTWTKAKQDRQEKKIIASYSNSNQSKRSTISSEDENDIRSPSNSLRVPSSVKKQKINDKIVEEFLENKLGSRHRYISKDGKYIYHLGIIDPL
jgi:hypothetical protein